MPKKRTDDPTEPRAAQTNRVQSFAERYAEIKEDLERADEALERLLGGLMESPRFRQMILLAITQNRKLATCTTGSLILATLQIARLQLSPDPTLQQAWLIPRKDKKSGLMQANFQLGAQGVKTLLYRSPRVLAVRTGVVWEGDEFEFRDGLAPVLYHVPHADKRKEVGETGRYAERDLIAAWGAVDLQGGVTIPEVMWPADIRRVRQMSQGGSVWRDHFEAMCRKSVLIQLRKNAPMGSGSAPLEAWRAMELDQAGEAGEAQLPLPEDQAVLEEALGADGRVVDMSAAQSTAEEHAQSAEGQMEDFIGQEVPEF